MKRVGLASVPEKNLKLEHRAKLNHFTELLEGQVLPYLRKNKKPSNAKFSPNCFINYAWGNPQHEHWVKEFAEVLEKAGLTVWFDRFEDKSGKEIASFALEKIPLADFILVIGTPLYKEKYEKKAIPGGAEHVLRAEMRAINGRLLESSDKSDTVIPVLIDGTMQTSFPLQLETLKKVPRDFVKNDYFQELLKLIQDLHGIDTRDAAFAKFFDKIKRYAVAASIGIQPEEQKAFAEKEEQQSLQEDAVVMADLERHKQSLMAESKAKPVAILKPRLSLVEERIEWNLPRQDNIFIGREALLQELEKALRREKSQGA